MDRKRINVLYQSSDYYAPYMGVSITSLLENNKWANEINCYILDDSIGEENKAKLDQLICQKYGRKLIYIETGRLSQELEKRKIRKWKNSYTAWFKILAIDYLDEDVDRILYLDADTMIDQSIDSLYYTDFGDNMLAMVQDIIPTAYTKSIGVKETDAYCNAGMFLLDVNQWREKHCTQIVLDHLNDKQNHYFYADQDTLNALFSSQTKKMGIECDMFTHYLFYGADIYYKMWSLQNVKGYYSLREIREKCEHAMIYHFIGIGSLKPWEYGANSSLTSRWNGYLALSPWKDMEKPCRPNTVRKVHNLLWRYLPHWAFCKVYQLNMKVQQLKFKFAK